MRPVNRLQWVLLAAVVSIVGCNSNNKGKIEGTKWSSLPTTAKGQSVPAGALKLEFHKDGGLVYRAGLQKFTGTYSLGMGDRVTLKLDKELAGRKVHTETVTVDGDRLTMKDSDGTSLSFSKVK
jgi:hypothetical protein